MIKYALRCHENHEFEAWFSSSEDFETQAKRGFVSCPVCNSSRVEKQLMRPRVSGSRKREAEVPMATQTGMDPKVVERLRALKKEVERNSDDVGERFTEEARSMHYGEKPQRGIRGKASMEQAKELLEEGVGVLPLPVLPDDKN